MIHINLTTTRFPKLAEPEPLPHITEDARSAFQCGWWNGICVGALIGSCCMYILLLAIGRVAS